jgi:hypothetical protein
MKFFVLCTPFLWVCLCYTRDLDSITHFPSNRCLRPFHFWLLLIRSQWLRLALFVSIMILCTDYKRKAAHMGRPAAVLGRLRDSKLHSWLFVLWSRSSQRVNDATVLLFPARKSFTELFFTFRSLLCELTVRMNKGNPTCHSGKVVNDIIRFTCERFPLLHPLFRYPLSTFLHQ